MNCRQAENLISSYLDGELAEAERPELEAHLASCPACRQYAEELEAAQAALAGVFAAAEPPADLFERLMARVREAEAGARPAGRARQPWWPGLRRAAAVAGLAAAVGLACLGLGRTGFWPLNAPGTPEGSPQVAANQEAPSPVLPAGLEAAPELSAPDEAEEPAGAPAVTPKAQPPGGPATVGETRAVTGSAGLRPAAPKAGRPAEPATTSGEATRLASADTASAPAVKTFLSHSRHVRTTVLRLAVADLEAARAEVAAAAIGAGALSVQAAWSYQQEQVMLRVVLPVGSAPRFAAEVSGLGEVLGRTTDTADVTAEFERRLAEYRELAAQDDPQAQALARAAEKVLEALDRESLEAGREVVNVWLKVR
ncbi:MAG: zf-HC2 domain-containing protein [Moorellales bacterium]